MESLSRLGIDLWSLLLYAVNFGVVVWLVAKYLTKPLLKMLDERRDKIKGNLDEAESLKTEMAKKLNKVEREKKDMEQKLHDELSAFRKDLDAKQKEAEAVMDEKRAKMFEEAKQTIDAEKARLLSDVKSDLLAKVQKMVLHIVSNQVPEEVIKKSVQEAWQKYEAPAS